jgi:hypothetical protein
MGMNKAGRVEIIFLSKFFTPNIFNPICGGWLGFARRIKFEFHSRGFHSFKPPGQTIYTIERISIV